MASRVRCRRCQHLSSDTSHVAPRQRVRVHCPSEGTSVLLAEQPTGRGVQRGRLSDRPIDMDVKGFLGVFIHRVDQLQPTTVGGFTELEVDRSHMIRVLGSSKWLAGTGPTHLPLRRCRADETFFPPQRSQFLVIDLLALTTQHRVRLLPSKAGMLPSEPSQPAPQLHILSRLRTMRSALGGPVLAHHPTRPTRHRKPLLHHHHDAVATIQGHHFPSASSINIALSSSANSFFRRGISVSSSFNRFAASAFIPP